MKTYLEISISATEHQRELLLPTMTELGCEGFQETDTALLCYINKERWTEQSYQTFQSELKSLLGIISSNATVQFRELKEENWNEQWERTLLPVEVGNTITVKPTWTSYDNPGNRLVILIDPKMSFGTGYHETTRLTLRLLERYIRNGSNVLDVGTGTGILAIASIKLGAAKAVGIDIDEWSIDNARENIIMNNVARQVQIENQPVDNFLPQSFDLITANLTLNTNAELLEQFHSALIPQGILLLSGLLLTDATSMKKQLLEKHFTIIDELIEHEWIAIAAQKSS
ncbi:MAG TPA: 50S ribosomal protein L11 methyltransferase [Bacteroidota bacterium]|nr:50S ribosomal protein L11 methyltransferase [Bacteroidota bacterium]